MSTSPEHGAFPQRSTACYSVHAPADPSVMPRVLDVFTRRGLIPTVWHSAVLAGDPGEIQIDIQVADLESAAAERLAQCLRQLVCVGCVLTSEKRQGLAAGEAA
jgi:acetolactate synthase regulatory subunit